MRVTQTSTAAPGGDPVASSMFRLSSGFSVIAACALLIACDGSKAGANRAAPTFSQVVVFGDSTVDSGFYRAPASPGGSATFNDDWAAAVANGAGVPTSSPGQMYPQIVAGYFGLTANPANQSGGTNYATSGAKNASVNTPANGGFTAAIPTVTQISGYLSTVGNRADAKALYLVSSGGNDVSFASGQVGTGPFPADPAAYLSDSAGSLAMAVAGLASAGAKTIVVANQPASFPMNNTALQQLRAGYNDALFSGLAAQKVSIIPADINSVRVSIQGNPGHYGFTSVSNEAGATACTTPAGITTAWALLCSSSPGAPSSYASPGADTTSLFADDQHLSTAGQRVVAEYVQQLLLDNAGSD